MLAYPDETFRGKVVRIGNRVESASRTLDVRIAVRNEDGRLKPGMFADVEIATTAVGKDALIIPDKALQSEEEGQMPLAKGGAATFPGVGLLARWLPHELRLQVPSIARPTMSAASTAEASESWLHRGRCERVGCEALCRGGSLSRWSWHCAVSRPSGSVRTRSTRSMAWTTRAAKCSSGAGSQPSSRIISASRWAWGDIARCRAALLHRLSTSAGLPRAAALARREPWRRSPHTRR